MTGHDGPRYPAHHRAHTAAGGCPCGIIQTIEEWSVGCPAYPGAGTGCGTGYSPGTPARDCAPGRAPPRLMTASISDWAGAGCWSAGGSGPTRRWTCTAPTGPPWSVRSWKKPASSRTRVCRAASGPPGPLFYGLHWHEGRQRWIATASLGFDAAGRRVVKRGSGRTKTEAKRRLMSVLRSWSARVHDLST